MDYSYCSLCSNWHYGSSCYKICTKLLLLVSMCVSCAAMDHPSIPKEVRDSYHEAMAQVQKAKEETVKNKRHSRERSTVDIRGTITEADGKETVIDIVQESTLSKSGGDTPKDGDSGKEGYTRRFVVVTNSVTAVLTMLIGAGVTLAVKFSDCKKE